MLELIWIGIILLAIKFIAMAPIGFFFLLALSGAIMLWSSYEFWNDRNWYTTNSYWKWVIADFRETFKAIRRRKKTEYKKIAPLVSL